MVKDQAALAVCGGTPTISGDPHRGWPEVSEEDRRAVQRVMDRGVFAGAHGPEVMALEEEYASYVGVKHAVVVNSGTAALHAGAVAAGVRPGDEVIVPAYGFVATAMAMAHQGAHVVFCDVNGRTYNLDVADLERRITDRTRAIVAVHIHGLPADVDEIEAVAERRGVKRVIEDNAQAHGIRYRGRVTGGITGCAATSTNQSKNLSAGEGGIFTTDDEAEYRAARRLSVFGEDLAALERRDFWSHGLGWNYRSQELACALARSQLPRVDGFNARAEENARRLTEGLEGLPGVVVPHQPDDRGCSYWKYALQLDAAALGFEGDVRDLRDRVLVAVQAEGVEAMLWQPQPIPAQPAFRGRMQTWQPGVGQVEMREWDRAEFPVASELCDRTLHLGTEAKPLYVQEPKVMDRYVQAVRKVLSQIDVVSAMPYVPRRRMV